MSSKMSLLLLQQHVKAIHLENTFWIESLVHIMYILERMQQMQDRPILMEL